MTKKILIIPLALCVSLGCSTAQKSAPRVPVADDTREQILSRLILGKTPSETASAQALQAEAGEQAAGEAVAVARKVEIGRRKNGSPRGYEYISIATGQVVAREIIDDAGARSLTGRIPDGLIVQYSPEGNVVAEFNYNAGRLEGIVKEFDPQGNVAYIKSYKAGHLCGLTRKFYPDGSVHKEINYHGGLRHGATRKFSPGGALISVEQYRDDVLEGTAREFYVTGVLKKETEYALGRIDGYQREFDPTGIKRSEHYYGRGVLSGVSRLFYEEGGIHMEIRYVDGKREGDTRIFSVNNPQTPIYIDTYRNDKKIRRRAFTATGDLLFVLDY